MMPDPSNTKEILTPSEACAFFEITERTLKRWMLERNLPHVRIGPLLRFRRIALLEWAELQERLTMSGRPADDTPGRGSD